MTPFDSSGEIDEPALVTQAHRVADNGLGLWLASSGTAEGNTLSAAEMNRIADTVVGEVGDRAFVAAMGSEPRTAQQAIEFGRRMTDAGVAAVQVGPLDPGHSFLPSVPELQAFYDEVLNALEVDCVLASHMSVGYDVPVAVLEEFSAHPAVIAVTTTQLREYTYTPRVLRQLVGQVPVLAGSPVHMLEAFAAGASGVVSSFDANVAPQLYRQLGDAFESNQLDSTFAAYTRLSHLFLRILGSGALSMAKEILNQLGVEVGHPRPPRQPSGPSLATEARGIIEEFGLTA